MAHRAAMRSTASFFSSRAASRCSRSGARASALEGSQAFSEFFSSASQNAWAKETGIRLESENTQPCTYSIRLVASQVPPMRQPNHRAASSVSSGVRPSFSQFSDRRNRR